MKYTYVSEEESYFENFKTECVFAGDRRNWNVFHEVFSMENSTTKQRNRYL